MVKNGTRVVTSVFGVLAGLAGLEHGIGEILQGAVRPTGVLILSWPGSRLFAILGGEPAMTLVPSLLVSGLLTVLVSLGCALWALGFLHRRHGALVLFGLSATLLLVGGGFGPPLLGLTVSLAAARIRSPHTWATRRPRLGRLLQVAWPWAFAGGLAAWLLLLPGIPLLAYGLGVQSATLVAVVILSALSLLALSIFCGFARDARAGTAAVARTASRHS